MIQYNKNILNFFNKILLVKFVIFVIIFTFSAKNLLATDIPIIVIAPSKKAQSISTVGTSVTVFNQETLEKSNSLFLGDTLNSGTTGFNYFQSGGHGTTSGIQLRGLPKAYSTVYIDGVKMSDASTPKNDYYFDDITTSQISRVEILKGNQSSVYGSGAMGGTINITTKKGQPGFQKNVFYKTGSNASHGLGFSLGGADDYKDYYIGLERYQTDGISAMEHNDEDDGYKNHTLVANYGYKISDTIKFTTNYRFVDAKLEYDSVNKDYRNDLDNSHEKESTASIAFSYKPNKKFTNILIFANAYISRTGNDIISAYTNEFAKNGFWSYRNAFNYKGIYNFNLDNSVVFGIEKEWDEMDYEKKNGMSDAEDVKKGEETVSQYIDYQSRLTKNLYATVGIRFDDHTQSGNEDSERISLAYLFDDKNTKLKASYGTGIKYPSLYEFYKSSKPSLLVAEHGRSYDFGLEKFFPEKGLNFDITFFDHKYEDTIEGWESASWTPWNRPGTVRTRGIEFVSKFKLNELLNFNFNYTNNSTYDGADFDDPDLTAGAITNSQIVRIPRHLFNLVTEITPNKNLDFTWKVKWSDTMRDYGNVNVPTDGSASDVRLDDFLVNDLAINYKLDGYKVFLKVNNVFDEEYNTALQYSQMNRAFNFGIKRLF